jgi:probable addiction module antidote protein
MPKRTVNFKEQLLEDLANPNEAALYLNAAAEESEEMLLIALRDVAEAKQMAQVAEKAGVAREALYRMLSKYGNPTYNSLRGVLNALGIRMCFAPIETLASGPRLDIANMNAMGASWPREIQGVAKRKEPSRQQAVSSGGMPAGANLIAAVMPKGQWPQGT